MGCRQSTADLLQEPLDTEVIANHQHDVDSRHHGMSDEHFSQHHKTLLRDTWKIINGENHGIAIFILIFQRKPAAKKVFPFKDLEGQELLQNPSFLAHAKRFMCAIGSTIDNLDALDVALIPTLYKLGEIHGWVPGFSDEYLPVFIDCIIDVMTQNIGAKCTDEVRQAWTQLGEFISHKLKEGYDVAQVKKTSLGHINHNNGTAG